MANTSPRTTEYTGNILGTQVKTERGNSQLVVNIVHVMIEKHIVSSYQRNLSHFSIRLVEFRRPYPIGDKSERNVGSL